MAATNWNIGISGSWTVGGNWSAGAPGLGTDASVAVAGTYTISLNALGYAHSLTLNAAGATLLEGLSGSLDIATNLNLQSGRAILNRPNTITNGVIQTGGLLEVGDSGALGAATYTFSGGELLAIADVTLTNQLAMKGNITIAAAHGVTLTQNATTWNFNATTPGGVVFGQGGNDGTIVWHANPGSSVTNPGAYPVEVAAGTFQAGNQYWDFIFYNGNKSQVDAGATLDMAGFAGTLKNLQGAGTITDSGAAATLSITGGGAFSGAIKGGIRLETTDGALTLSGANTYTGGTQIDSGATLQLGTGGTTGAVTGSILDNGTLIYDRSNAVTISPALISGTGAVTYEGGGAYTINGAQAYSGATQVIGSSVTTNNGSAFGTGTLTLNNSQLFTSAVQTAANMGLVIGGTSAIAAAHGTSTTNVAAGGNWSLTSNAAPVNLVFGDSANDGTVIWNTPPGSNYGGAFPITLEVRGGTLKAADSSFDFMTSAAVGLALDAGTTLDQNGFAGVLRGLTGTGSVTSHGGANITISGGDFGGVISGDVPIAINGAVFLTGSNTFTGGTTVNANAVLSLGEGGTTGSVLGDIVDNGNLYYDHSNSVALTAGISGTGVLTQAGSGVMTINRAESYTGGTNILGGALSIGEADAIGTGPLSITGGELLATASMSLSNKLNLSDASTILANTGTTLALNTSVAWFLDAVAPASIVFGDSGHAGTIVWFTPAGSGITYSAGDTVAVNAGVLKAGDGELGFLLSTAANSVTVAAAGTIDVAGFDTQIDNLQGAGKVINSGAAATLTIDSGTFSGQLNGAQSLSIYETVTLTGGGSYTGGVQLQDGAILNLADTATRAVTFVASGSLNVTNASGVSETLNLTLGGGTDAITGGAGNETFNIGAGLTAGDQVNTGAGTDTVSLTGDYSGGLTLGATTLLNAETLKVGAGFNYNLTTNDATVAAGQTLTVDASALGAGNGLTFNGAAETNGAFAITGGAGADTLTGGSLADTIDGGGGNNVLNGGGGNDALFGGAGNDTFNGGAGTDTVSYAGASAGVTVSLLVAGGQNTGGAGTDTLSSIEKLIGSNFADTLTANNTGSTLLGGSGGDDLISGAGSDILNGGLASDFADYTLAGSGVTVSLAISGFQSTGGGGSDELVSIEKLAGSAFADTLTGDANSNSLFGNGGADVITGGGGQDTLSGGAGNDTFVFTALGDSTVAAPDTISDFQAGDKIDLHLIDANTGVAGDQAFHLGATPGHAGDIVVGPFSGGHTLISLYVNADATADAAISLTGDHTGIAAGDFIL